jgi:ADP-ribose pyrophosphatase YjhB (NUDIX family)
MARTPVLAAGGIVLRQADMPLIAVVRLRKRDEWVLPKGKLDDGETPRAAAEREVREETGYNVSVHEFLGTLVYESGGRSKVVHYWRMKANGGPVRELMHDVRLSTGCRSRMRWRGCRADMSRRFCRRSARSHLSRGHLPRPATDTREAGCG